MTTQYRRVHCSIDRLPADLVKTIIGMALDNVWPKDYEGEKIGKPRYEDMANYVQQKGFTINVYAIGRYCRRLGYLARMKEAGALVRDAMNNLSDEKASATQKAAAEILTAHVLEFLIKEDGLDSEQILNVSRAIKDSTWVVLAADKYIREQLQKKIQATKKDIAKVGKGGVIAPEVLKAIREQVYGIIDHHLGIKRQNKGSK